MRKQKGMAMVEFAIVAGTFFIILFGVIEVARALFVWNTIVESTRRGARVAIVCPRDHPFIESATIFGTTGDTTSPIINGLKSGNVDINYFTKDGLTPATDHTDTYFVNVSITGYTHTLLIPFLQLDLNMPPFTTTLPAESLGYIPESGAGSRHCPTL